MNNPAKTYRIISASAGAGKTYNLVKRYLAICLGSDDPMLFSRILAITFTNKAAAEMKHRVFLVLDAFQQLPVSGKYASLFQSIRDELAIEEFKLHERAGAVLKHMLHNYSQISISTIDRFNYRLVRTFSHDLGLSGNFEVVLETSELMGQTVELLLDKTGQDNNVTGALRRFVNEKMSDGRDWNIQKELNAVAHELVKEKNTNAIEKLSRYSAGELETIHQKIKKDIRTERAKIPKIGEDLNALISDFDPKIFTRQSLPNLIKSTRFGSVDKLKITDGLEKAMDSGSYTNKPYANRVSTELAQQITEKLEALLETCAHIEFRKEVIRNFNATSLLQEIDKTLQDYKTANNVEPLYTFNKLIHQSISNLPAPYVYERVGERYLHYFIDEFQDTSRYQWRNLIPLVHNAISSGGTAFVVGDAKQSIYGWRGGEAEQFLELMDQAKNPEEWPGDLSYAMQFSTLEDNWRSRRNIVEFNNDFFAKMGHVLGGNYRDIYQNPHQNVKGKEGGFVQIEYFNRKDEPKERQLENMVQRINRLVGEEGFSYRDIAVLVRSNNEGSAAYHQFVENGIPAVTNESLGLMNSALVSALVSAMKLLVYPNDHEARIAFLKNMRDAGIWVADDREWNRAMTIAVGRENTAWQAFMDEEEWNLQGSGLKKAGLYECGERLARHLGLLKSGSVNDAFLQFFLDELHVFSGNHTNGLNDFLEHWKTRGKKAMIVAPEEMDAVQIMTIHKSKGLEFPVVLLSFADWDMKNKDASDWLEMDSEKLHGLSIARVGIKKELFRRISNDYPEYGLLYSNFVENAIFDNLNLLYVAMTRPVERLYVSLKAPPKSAGSADRPSSMDHLFHQFIGEYVEEGIVYISGEEKPHEKEGGGEKAHNYGEGHSNDWRKRVLLSRKTGDLADGQLDNPRTWGKLVHEILADIKHAGDAGKAVNRLSASGRLPEMHREAVGKMIGEIISLPELSEAFYADEVYTERDWLSAEGVFRPDRISRKGDKWIVIDYKTGIPRSEHKRQVENYLEILRSDGREATGKLLYLGEQLQVVEVESHG